MLKSKDFYRRGLHGTEEEYLLGLIPRVPEKNFRGKIIDVAEVNQQHWIEERGQWLENVDRTHLVLASGKPVLQKKFFRRRSSQSMQSSCAP